MARLLVRYDKEAPNNTVTLDNVADAGIAGDFLVIRYTDGVVTFTKHYDIDDVQFDPTGDEPQDGEGQDDTADQQ